MTFPRALWGRRHRQSAPKGWLQHGAKSALGGLGQHRNRRRASLLNTSSSAPASALTLKPAPCTAGAWVPSSDVHLTPEPVPCSAGPNTTGWQVGTTQQGYIESKNVHSYMYAFNRPQSNPMSMKLRCKGVDMHKKYHEGSVQKFDKIY